MLSGLCSLDSVPGTEYLVFYEINYLILKRCNYESQFPGLNQGCKCFCHKVSVKGQWDQLTEALMLWHPYRRDRIQTSSENQASRYWTALLLIDTFLQILKGWACIDHTFKAKH